MNNDENGAPLTFVVPAHTLTGDVRQLLAEIDDTIEALQVIRAEVLARAPKPAKPAREGWWRRIAHAWSRLAVSPIGRQSDTRPMAR